MKYSFKSGDIVVFRETEDSIGYINLSFQTKERSEKERVRYRKFRAEVVKIFDYPYHVDKDGDPTFQLKRLDTKAHGLESWSQGFFVHAKD